jgi:hypothetical protein
MKKNSSIKIKIVVSDPWDSKEVITGFFYKQVSIGDLASLLIRSEKGEWVALLPRHEGQHLINDSKSKKKFPVNIAKFMHDEFPIEKMEPDQILFYAIGSAEVIE